jgi:hypothetical protein
MAFIAPFPGPARNVGPGDLVRGPVPSPKQRTTWHLPAAAKLKPKVRNTNHNPIQLSKSQTQGPKPHMLPSLVPFQGDLWDSSIPLMHGYCCRGYRVVAVQFQMARFANHGPQEARMEWG